MRTMHDLDVIQLNVSQAMAVMAVQQFDEQLAVELNESATIYPQQLESALTNDGTNACTFLSVKITDIILSEFWTGYSFCRFSKSGHLVMAMI